MVVSHGKSLKSFDQGQKPSLLLDFARRKSLIDQVSKSNLITFTRATAATYVGVDGLIKTAALGEARFDHNPVTGESLGLLIEEQRTNLIDYSQDFSIWNYSGLFMSVSTGYTAPDGSTNGWLLSKTDVFTSIGISRQIFPTSSTNVHSWFLKAGTAAETIVSVYDATTGSSKWAAYSWAGGVPSVSGVTSEAEAFDPVYYGNGWWRVSVKVSNLNSVNPNFSFLYPAGLGTATGTVYVWGAQLEAGAFPTSYIPTTTASVTRNFDSVLIDGANFSSWYNQNEGSFFAEYQRPHSAVAVGQGYPRVFSVSQGAASTNRIFLYSSATFLPGAESLETSTGGIITSFIQHTPGIGAGESARRSISYSATLSKVSSSRDGGVPIEDTSAAVSTLMDRIRLGASFIASQFHNGTIKRFIYWPTRLDNSDLQEATR